VLTLPLSTACPEPCNKSPFSAFKKKKREENKDDNVSTGNYEK
jgi:hypothetical protein